MKGKLYTMLATMGSVSKEPGDHVTEVSVILPGRPSAMSLEFGIPVIHDRTVDRLCLESAKQMECTIITKESPNIKWSDILLRPAKNKVDLYTPSDITSRVYKSTRDRKARDSDKHKRNSVKRMSTIANSRWWNNTHRSCFKDR